MSDAQNVLPPGSIFVSMTGPKLSKSSERAMRAHTTKANFRKRRLQLVREYANQHGHTGPESDHSIFATKRSRKERPGSPVVQRTTSIRKLNYDDEFLIEYLTESLEKLHTATDIPMPHGVTTSGRAHWRSHLKDPVNTDVSLYWARLVYAGRLQKHALQLIADESKGSAMRSIRERLSDGPDNLNDNLMAGILILTVLDQLLGNIAEWKIHLCALIRITSVRADLAEFSTTCWICGPVPRTVMQGLLLFTRHDSTLLPMIERTGIFNTMFSISGSEAAHIILAVSDQLGLMQEIFRLTEIKFDQILQLLHLIKSLDTVMHLSDSAYAREAFLAAIALSLKIYLTMFLNLVDPKTQPLDNDMADQLKNAFRKSERAEEEFRFQTALEMCASLESRYWQTMMGALIASGSNTLEYHVKRLGRLGYALALNSWQDAVAILQRYYCLPSALTDRAQLIFNESIKS